MREKGGAEDVNSKKGFVKPRWDSRAKTESSLTKRRQRLRGSW